MQRVNFLWISVIRLPDFVKKADFDWAVEAAALKKKIPTDEMLDKLHDMYMEGLPTPQKVEAAVKHIANCWTANTGFGGSTLYVPYVKVNVTNKKTEAVSKITVKVVFYDETEKSIISDETSYLVSSSDDILYIGNDSLYNSHGLTPGSSIVIKAEIPSTSMDYFTAKGIKPTVLDVIAYVDR